MDLNSRSKSNLKLAPNAKKVFEGILFDVYQWEQEQFNGKIRTFEMAVRPDTICTLPITKDKKILVTRQIQPGWDKYIYQLPGGMVNKDEVFLDAIKRELMEETGYKAESYNYWFTKKLGAKVDRLIVWTIAHNCEKITNELEADDGGEEIELILLSFDEFMEMVFHPDFKDEEIKPFFMEAKYVPEKMDEIKKLLGIS